MHKKGYVMKLVDMDDLVFEMDTREHKNFSSKSKEQRPKDKPLCPEPKALSHERFEFHTGFAKKDIPML